MRIAGWSQLGYYPTPDRVTDMIASHISDLPVHTIYHPHESSRNEPRTVMFDPCCGEGKALHAFSQQIGQKARQQNGKFPENAIRTYGVELHRERAATARKRLDQVWIADIDNARIRPQSYHYLWLNPPYDWSEDEDHDGSRRLESRFLHHATWGLTDHGILIYIIPDYVLRYDATFLARHYRNLRVLRFPEPEYQDYKQVVVIGNRRPYPDNTTGHIASELADLARPDADIPILDYVIRGLNQINAQCRTAGYPVRVMPFSPQDIAQAVQTEGLWQRPELRQMFDTAPDPARIKPIEALPEGHAAMVAANSMVDNVIIRDPEQNQDPVIIRGFFRKQNRETFRSDKIAVRTDYFESNIRALNTRTGHIDEVGSDPEGLQNFMATYGPVIQQQVAATYKPSVDLRSPQCQRIRERLRQLKRPLLGKQLEAAVTGAAYLKNHKHLNLFFMQGSGKTCTSFAVGYGLNASKVAVVTPTRVIPNWINEIRSVWPDAIIRVVRNDQPIGHRAPPSPSDLAYRPPPFGRTSLEDIRRLESWATPETPLWILLKKDSARNSHPTEHGLRYIGDAPHAAAFRPLRQLIRAERRIAGLPAAHHDHNPGTTQIPKRLYRDQRGKLCQLPSDSKPVGTCPQCWYPLTTDEAWKPKDRDAVCINPAENPKFPAMLRDIDPDDDQQIERLPTVSCQAPIATAVRDRRGRAVYSYGDYLSRYMGKWLDLLIIDEAQDYKARDTAQGGTIRRMAQRARRTLALTGTPFGGKVSEVFYLLVALNPGFAEQFGYRDLGAFRKIYGREETTYDLKDGDDSIAVGSSSRRRQTKKDTKEIPGYHPALLEHFWHNTIFASIHDIDPGRQLPSMRQRAELVPLDPEPQEHGPAAGYSQAEAYAVLDDALTENLKAHLQKGSRRPLSQYLQETLTYPENCWQGAEPLDPDTDDIIISIPPLSAHQLYPKERKLLSLLADQKARGRKCLVYCTHTNRRDTTERLLDIIRQHNYRALQLKAGTVDSEARTKWLAEQARLNDVIICHPKLVETGVNLLEYPTIIWYEIEYSMYTTEQASARSYRINQRQPVEVYYLAYENTMQERALRLIARKADVSRTFHGDLSKNGLSAFNPDPDDIREQLARQMLAHTSRHGNGHHPEPNIGDLNEWLAVRDINATPVPATESEPLPPATTPEMPPAAAPQQWDNRDAKQLSLLFG